MRTLNHALIRSGRASGLSGYWEEYQYQDKSIATMPAASDVGTSWSSSLVGGITDLAKTYLMTQAQKDAAKLAITTRTPGTITSVTPGGVTTQTAAVQIPATSTLDGILKNPLTWAAVGLGAYLLLKKRKA